LKLSHAPFHLNLEKTIPHGKVPREKLYEDPVENWDGEL